MNPSADNQSDLSDSEVNLPTEDSVTSADTTNNTDETTETDETIEPGTKPTIEWHVGQGTNLEEHVHEGLQTQDGGYLAIGDTQATSQNDQLDDILIIKVDSNGDLEWQQKIGTAGVLETGIAILETPENDIIAGVGLSSSAAPNGMMKATLLRLDSQGNLLWQQIYNHSGNGAIRGMTLLDNGDIVAVGYRQSPIGGYQFIADEAQGFIMQVDSSGALLWDSSLPVTQGTKVQPSGDGFMVLSTGWVFENGIDTNAVFLIKTDSNGQEEWTKTYSSSGMNQAFDFDQTSDGGFAIAGHTTGYGSQNWDCLLIRTDNSGGLIWEATFGNPRGYNPLYVHDECYGIREMPNGDLVMVGGTGDEYSYSENTHSSGSSDEWKAYVVRVNSNGTLQWEAVYGDNPNSGHNAAEFLTLTQDGGVMLFNDTDSAGDMNPNNFGFMKLSP